LKFFADADEVRLASKAPIMDLDGIQSSPASLRLAHKGLVHIQGEGQLFLSEFSMHPNIAEQFRKDSMFWPVDAFPRHRSIL
jgi:hypothetical protein